MDRPSLKKIIISNLCNITELEALKDNDINLLTPSGIISGRLSKRSNEEEPTNGNDVLAETMEGFSQRYKEVYNIKNSVPGNDGFIILENVTIRQIGSESTCILDQLTVFYDQIVGISLGKITVHS